MVYRGLVALEQALSQLDPFPAATRFSGVLGIDEKWVKIPKSFSDKERAEGKKWRYAFFAVDAHGVQPRLDPRGARLRGSTNGGLPGDLRDVEVSMTRPEVHRGKNNPLQAQSEQQK